MIGGLAWVAVVSPAERGVDADGYADGCDASEVLAWVAIVSPAERGVDDACSAELQSAGLVCEGDGCSFVVSSCLLICRSLSAIQRHRPIRFWVLRVN